jgi:hypothetical protein
MDFNADGITFEERPMDTLQFENAPRQSYRLLRKILPAKWQPFLRGVRKLWGKEV